MMCNNNDADSQSFMFAFEESAHEHVRNSVSRRQSKFAVRLGLKIDLHKHTQLTRDLSL
jgi:hypothetical protein